MFSNGDWDRALQDLLAHRVGGRQFSADDRALIKRMLEAMENGADGVIIVKHPDSRLEYLIANSDRGRAIQIMAQAIDRNAAMLPKEADHG